MPTPGSVKKAVEVVAQAMWPNLTVDELVGMLAHGRGFAGNPIEDAMNEKLEREISERLHKQREGVQR